MNAVAPNDLPALITIIEGPWTLQARADAVESEIREAFHKYFNKAMKFRAWSPWDKFDLHEIARLGKHLSPDTATIMLAYLGVEDYVGDYVEDGLKIIGHQRDRRNLQLAWGAEEMKHAETWELVLTASGLYNEAELRDYRKRVHDHKWTMGDEHPGLDTPLGVACYAMVQERATYFNYEQMRRRIINEYALESGTPSDTANRRGEPGAAYAFKVVANDEIAHHGIFLELVRISAKYFPHETFDTLLKVFNGFTMPAIDLIPNASELKEAMERTLLHTPRNQVREVNNPILKAMGFRNKKALEQAVQQAKMLPDGLGPEHVTVSDTGEFVLSMTPS
jgi:acyl-[acyl-carrier-protein] desaturase